jgi:hypothetical protein
MTLIFILMTVYLLSIDIESLQTSLVPNTAKWFIHIDVAKLSKTQIKKIFTEKYDSDLEHEILGIEETANIDFFEDITAVTAIGMDEGSDEPVIAFSGNLNKEYLLSLLKDEEYEEIPYGSYLVYSWDSEYGVFVSDKLLLIGESEEGIKKVLDTYSGNSANILSTPLESYLKSLSPDAFLLAVAEDIMGMIDEDDDDFGSLLLKKTKQAFLSATEKNDRLTVKLNLETDSGETAKNLIEMANGLKAFLAMNEKIDPEWEFIKDLKIGSQGSTVYLESQGSSSEILHILFGLEK